MGVVYREAVSSKTVIKKEDKSSIFFFCFVQGRGRCTSPLFRSYFLLFRGGWSPKGGGGVKIIQILQARAVS